MRPLDTADQGHHIRGQSNPRLLTNLVMDSHLASDIRYGARHKRVILTTASQASKTTKMQKSLKAFYRIIRKIFR